MEEKLKLVQSKENEVEWQLIDSSSQVLGLEDNTVIWKNVASSGDEMTQMYFGTPPFGTQPFATPPFGTNKKGTKHSIAIGAQ